MNAVHATSQLRGNECPVAGTPARPPTARVPARYYTPPHVACESHTALALGVLVALDRQAVSAAVAPARSRHA